MAITKKEYNKKWALEHYEERKLYKKNYRVSHKAQIKETRKKYYLEHREQELKLSKIYQEKYKETLKQYRNKTKPQRKKYKTKYDNEHQKEQTLYRKNRRELRNRVLNEYMKEPTNKIIRNLRVRLWSLLKGKNKSESTMKLLGCSIGQLKIHLEGQFKGSMNWNNYGKYGWHVDHIKQCASFNLSKAAEQSKCFHYTNLRPLWAKENLSRPRIKKLI